MFSKLLRALRRRVEREDGFTLIELLVVILIIGILAAVAIPLFLNQQSKAQDSNAVSNLKNAEVSTQSYMTGQNLNPANLTSSNLSTSIVNSAEGSWPSAVTMTVPATGGGYTLTDESASGNTYTLAVSSSGVETDDCSVTAANQPSAVAANGSVDGCTAAAAVAAGTGFSGTWGSST